MLDPHDLLKNVHPDLVKIITNAAQSPQPFQVVYGIRTEAAERQAVATGHSQTLHSRHLPQSHENMKSCAVDVAAVTNGKLDWAPGHEQQVFGQIWNQIKISAETLKIPVEWGGDWHSFKDWGHIQLPWSSYP